MSDRSCDGFEIAIEMRCHAAADPATDARLDAHLAECEGCRAYAALARGTDDALRRRSNVAPTSVEDFRQRIERSRRTTLFGGIFVAVVWAPLLGALWLIRAGLLRTRIFDPIPQVLPVLVGLTVFATLLVAGWLTWGLARRRQLRTNAAPEVVFAGYRRDLRWAIRAMAWGLWAMVLGSSILAWDLVRRHVPLDERLLRDNAQVWIAAILTAYSYFIGRPRLKREIDELDRLEGPPGGVP